MWESRNSQNILLNKLEHNRIVDSLENVFEGYSRVPHEPRARPDKSGINDDSGKPKICDFYNYNIQRNSLSIVFGLYIT